MTWLEDIGFEPRIEPPEPPIWGVCDCCGEYIYTGEKVAYISGKNYCVNCIESSTDVLDKRVTCEDCGEKIPAGETLYYIDGKHYCKDCVDSAFSEADYEAI